MGWPHRHSPAPPSTIRRFQPINPYISVCHAVPSQKPNETHPSKDILFMNPIIQHQNAIPSGTRMLGSTGSLFLNQQQGDIYFESYGDEGPNFRIVLVTVTWGVSIVLVQFSPNPHVFPWWFSAASLVHLDVLDLGQQHVQEAHVPTPLHNDVPIVNNEPEYVSDYVGNDNVIYQGWSVRWHHDVQVHRSTLEGPPRGLHYHAHPRWNGHGPGVGNPTPGGRHYVFYQLRYSTQVTNSCQARN